MRVRAVGEHKASFLSQGAVICRQGFARPHLLVQEPGMYPGYQLLSFLSVADLDIVHRLPAHCFHLWSSFPGDRATYLTLPQPGPIPTQTSCQCRTHRESVQRWRLFVLSMG
jgi:hypothetical protein